MGHGSLSRDIAQRLSFAPASKAIGTVAALCFFFGLYYGIPRSAPHGAAWFAPSWVDCALPLWDAAVLPYVSLWLYVVLVPALCATRRALAATMLAFALLAVAGLLSIHCFPLQARHWAAPDAAGHPLSALLQAADGQGGGFPSLHAAFAMLAGLMLDWQLGTLREGGPLRPWNRWWCLAIVLSTLLARPHRVVDALAGVALSLPAWWAYVCVSAADQAPARCPCAAARRHWTSMPAAGDSRAPRRVTMP